MKMTQVVIKPSELSQFKETLQQANIAGMTITATRAFDKHAAYPEIAEELVSKTPSTLQNAITPPKSGNIRDSWVFVFLVEEAIRLSAG